MNNNFIIFIITVWILLAIVGGIGEGIYLGQSAYGASPTSIESGTLYQLMHPSGFSWFAALFRAFTFDFSMFTEGYMVFQWVFFIPLTIALYVGLFGMISGYGMVGLLAIFGFVGITSWLA